MSTRTNHRRAAQKIFRRHKGLTLYLPGSLWLALLALIVGAALQLGRRSRYALWLLVFGVFPLVKMLWLYLTWRQYSVVATAGERTLVEHTGLANTTERRIPLSDFSSAEKHRAWWARLLGIDVGDAILDGMGGPFELRRMGDFADLWAVIESQGQRLTVGQAIAPPQYAQPLTPFVEPGYAKARLLEPQAAPVQTVRLVSLPEPSVHEDYVYQGEVFSPLIASYPGFYAFCEQFILTERDWTAECYRARDASRRYYRDGISPVLAYAYLTALREVCVLIPARNGHAKERVSSRIHSIVDIQRLLPDLSTRISQVA